MHRSSFKLRMATFSRSTIRIGRRVNDLIQNERGGIDNSTPAAVQGIWSVADKAAQT